MEHRNEYRTAPVATATAASVTEERNKEESTKGMTTTGLEGKVPVTNYVVRRFVQLAREMRDAQKIARTAPTKMNQNIADKAAQMFDRLLYAMAESDGMLYRMTAEEDTTPIPAPPPEPPKPVSVPDNEPKPGPSSAAAGK